MKPAIIVFRIATVDWFERPVLQFSIGKIDFERPPRVVQRFEPDAIRMLPIAIALRDVPFDEAIEQVHGRPNTCVERRAVRQS